MPYLADPARYESIVYRRCGRSGVRLPAISLGLWHNFGDERPWETQREICRGPSISASPISIWPTTTGHLTEQSQPDEHSLARIQPHRAGAGRRTDYGGDGLQDAPQPSIPNGPYTGAIQAGRVSDIGRY